MPPLAAPPELIDIGANLTHESFTADREEVLQRAVAAGVTRMLVTGSSVAGSTAAIHLAQQHPALLRATAGVHPHHASELDQDAYALLQQLLRSPQVLAVGECGLDFFRNFSPPQAQEQAFRMQLELARQLDKPVFLHQRDAHEPFLALLRECGIGARGGVAHCFTADVGEARVYLDLGLHLGITGWICDERRGAHLREVVRFIPPDRLLVETDAPYLLPRDLRPKPRTRRNEPAYLPHIVEVIAHHRGEDPVQVARVTTANALRLFDWK
jgi:TatD DNase family protein